MKVVEREAKFLERELQKGVLIMSKMV